MFWIVLIDYIQIEQMVQYSAAVACAEMHPHEERACAPLSAWPGLDTEGKPIKQSKDLLFRCVKPDEETIKEVQERGKKSYSLSVCLLLLAYLKSTITPFSDKPVWGKTCRSQTLRRRLCKNQ